jgi:hypothetical protein
MNDRKIGTAAPIQLMWNCNMGDGWLLFDNEWMDWDDVSKLDMLQDCIALLQDEYNETLELAFPGADDE